MRTALIHRHERKVLRRSTYPFKLELIYFQRASKMQNFFKCIYIDDTNSTILYQRQESEAIFKTEEK